MKSTSLHNLFLLLIFCNIFAVSKAQINTTDSLALVDLYNSTNGTSWTNNSNWLTTSPVSTWYGISVTDSRVTILSLHLNNLSGSLPSSIGNLAALQTIYLDHNALTGEIPSSIGRLTNLKILFLYFNQLQGSIPDSLYQLTNLQQLEMDDNAFTGVISPLVGNLHKLILLYLNGNLLTGSIPASINKLTRLQYLELEYTGISGNLPNVDKMVSLLGLNASSTNLSQNRNIVHGKDTTSNISLDISWDRFTFDGLEYIAKTFPYASYGNQYALTVHQKGDSLYVYAGGTLKYNTYTWVEIGKGSVKIKGDSAFHPTESGKYYAEIDNSHVPGTSLGTDVFYYTAPGVKDNNTSVADNALKSADLKTSFSVFPNPVKDVLHIQAEGTASFIFINNNGKVLLTKQVNNSSDIDVSNFESGVYYLQNKATGKTQKIVIYH